MNPAQLSQRGGSGHHDDRAFQVSKVQVTAQDRKDGPLAALVLVFDRLAHPSGSGWCYAIPRSWRRYPRYLGSPISVGCAKIVDLGSPYY